MSLLGQHLGQEDYLPLVLSAMQVRATSLHAMRLAHAILPYPTIGMRCVMRGSVPRVARPHSMRSVPWSSRSVASPDHIRSANGFEALRRLGPDPLVSLRHHLLWFACGPFRLLYAAPPAVAIPIAM
jgi:hypothetical protein